VDLRKQGSGYDPVNTVVIPKGSVVAGNIYDQVNIEKLCAIVCCRRAFHVPVYNTDEWSSFNLTCVVRVKLSN
jgi:hypothetical protein